MDYTLNLFDDFLRHWTAEDRDKVTVLRALGIRDNTLQVVYTATRDAMTDHTERILYHGTPSSCGTLDCDDCAACGITKAGFLKSKLCQNDSKPRFGAGFYFSPHSSAAHEYTQPKNRCIIICKVAVGRSLQSKESQPHLGTLPQGFDSVHGVASNVGDLAQDEFVVYNPTQVLPLAIIFYSISTDYPQSSSSTVPAPSKSLTTPKIEIVKLQTHPNVHIHPLIYTRARRYRGDSFTCDRCAMKSETSSWHCDKCAYDECKTCFAQYSGRDRKPQAHQHPLKFDNRDFDCDICLQPRLGSCMYCAACDWDECMDCYPKHSGLNARCTHNLTFGNRDEFTCDLCKAPGTGFSYFCNLCDWDVCSACKVK